MITARASPSNTARTSASVASTGKVAKCIGTITLGLKNFFIDSAATFGLCVYGPPPAHVNTMSG
jgi:hypothetical protein